MLVAVLAGDGIGPEVTAQARRVLDVLAIPGLEFEEAPVGGDAAVIRPRPFAESSLKQAGCWRRPVGRRWPAS